jgi:hypothetical protein
MHNYPISTLSRYARTRAVYLGALLLAACGGGGGGAGGGGGGGASSLPLAIALSPSSLSDNLVQSLPRNFKFKATVTGSVSGLVYVVITDNIGVLQGNSTITMNQDGTYTATITTSPNLSVGTHNGTLDIRACGDTGCSSLYGVTSLPYTFQVSAPSNLTTLSAWTGVPEWNTDRGNVAHTGYVPVTLDPIAFSPRWLWTPANASTTPGVYTFLSVPISDSSNQLLYVTSSNTNGTSSVIYALHESDATNAWVVNATAVNPNQYPGGLTVSNQVLYTSISNGNGPLGGMYFSAYNATTGATKYQTWYSVGCSASCDAGSPAISNTVAFVNPGWSRVSAVGSSPIMAFNVSTGAYLWTAQAGGASGAAPALDSQGLYTYIPNSSYQNGPGFTAMDPTTGVSNYSIGRPQTPIQQGQAYYNGSTPVLDGVGGALVVLGPGTLTSPLSHFDFSTKTLDWEIDGAYQSLPSVVNGTFFVGNASPFRLEARGVTDGGLLWSWSPPTYDGAFTFYSVVATQNLAFVSTDQTVYAIDLTTHLPVWSFPMGGRLSISTSGILYIQGGGKVAAVNLH